MLLLLGRSKIFGHVFTEIWNEMNITLFEREIKGQESSSWADYQVELLFWHFDVIIICHSMDNRFSPSLFSNYRHFWYFRILLIFHFRSRSRLIEICSESMVARTAFVVHSADKNLLALGGSLGSTQTNCPEIYT